VEEQTAASSAVASDEQRSARAGEPSVPNALDLGPFAERFVIERLLGRGGYGRVYRALDRAQKRRVALKVPHSFDARALLAVKDEFRTLAGISHRNLVAFHELFVGPEQWFFTMDLVRGVDCVHWAERAGPSSIHAVARGLAAGLEALHAVRIVHRDIKPSNAWVDVDGVPVLLDFGLARDLDRSGASAGLAGTALYIAPELRRGAAASPASDLYALGIVLHEMILGSAPRAGSVEAALGHELSDGAPRLSRARQRVAPDLAALLEALLDPDPAARPTASDVIRELDRGEPCARPPTVERPFLGRERELEQLSRVFEAVQSGSPRIVFVEGPAGIGKSSLAERFLATVSGPQVVVLRGRCSEHEAVPFKLLDGVLDALALRLRDDAELRDGLEDPSTMALLAEAFPVFSEVLAELEHPARAGPRALEPQERLRRVAQALASLLRDVGQRRTLVVLVDDVQWADEDGARLLEETLASLASGRVLFMVLRRGAAAGQPLAILEQLGPSSSPPPRRPRGDSRSIAAERLWVPPLGEEDSSRLLGAGVGSDLLAAAGGSPFLLEALATSGHAKLAPGESPADLLRRAVSSRIAALPGPARALLEATCVAGHTISQELVADALGVDVDVPSLRTLAAARLLKTLPAPSGELPDIEPYHDLLGKIVVELVGPDRARGLHAALARAFATRPDSDPMWTCLHLQGAGELGRAALYAEQGARRAAQTLAFARAADLYRFALTHRDREPASTRELEIALADALANAGRGREAADAFLAASRSAADARTRRELERSAAEQYLRAGYFTEGVRHLDAVLEAVGIEVRRTPAAAIRSLVANRFWLRRHGLDPASTRASDSEEERRIDALTSGAVGLSVVDSIRSADLMSEALRRSLASGDRTRLAASLAWWAAFVANGGGPAEHTTRTVLAAARRETAAHGGAYARACCEAAAGLTEFHLGHFATARRHFETGVAIFEQETRATTKEASTLHIFHHAALAMDGRLAELAYRTEDRVRISESRGERYALVNFRQGLMILRWLAADQPDRAEQDLRLAMDSFGVAGFVVQHWFDVWGQIAVLLYRGRARESRRLWTSTRPRLLASLLVRTQFTRVQSLALEVLTAAAVLEGGDASWAEALRLRGWARLAIAQVRAEDRPWTAALACLLEACVRGADGDAEAARALLEEALPALERADLGLYAALARYRLGGHDPIQRSLAQAWVEQEGVVDPDRLASAILPGLGVLTRSRRSR